MITLPLRAILIGDTVEGGGLVVDRVSEGEHHDPKWVELIFADGVTYEGDPDTELTVEEIDMSGWDNILASYR